MRDLILDLVDNINITGFSTSAKLPFDQNGEPLYLQNFKRLYVDLPQTEQDPLFTTLDGGGAVNETITIPVYVATDAKTLPNNYNQLLTAIRAIRISNSITGYNQRTTAVDTAYVDDSLVTTVTFVFVKTIIDH
jgi:hypothetical protein